MTVENRKSGNIFSRRQFIGSVMLATSAALVSARKKSRWQIGAYTRPWTKYDYRVAFDGMAEAGYKYVGLSTHDKGWLIDMNTTFKQAAVIGEEAKSRGLKIITVSGGYFDVKRSVEEGIAALKRAIDFSVSYGCSNVQISDNTGAETFYKVVFGCCDYAADKQVRIVLKPHGASGAECCKIIEKVGHRNFKLWYDPGNVYYYSDGKVNPVEDAEYLDGFVVGMAVKDFRLPKDVSVTPGTGMVDFPELLVRLRKGGFKGGPLVVEQTNTGEPAYITAEARKTRQFLEEITSNL